MAFLVLLVLFLFFFVVVPRLARRAGPVSGDARTRLLMTGLEARGLILSAASTGTQATANGQRFQVRNVVLDVEVPGRAPYEVSLSPMFPRLCETFPGTALDLRVDPKDPNNVVVVGPAGSSGWMHATAGLFPWATSSPLAAAKSGCGTAFVILVSLFLGAGAVLELIGENSGSSHDKPEPSEPSEEPTHPAPTPHVPRETPAPAVHPSCLAAERCCAVLGHTGCEYGKLSEAACKALLHDFEKTAAKQHKRCE